MNVKDVVERIVKQYKTRSPYELADLMDIYVVRHELGKIRGYYLEVRRIKQIILNCNLNHHDEKFVLAHELGHVIMHKGFNVSFLMDNTDILTSKMEIEANKFAVELLIPDEFILENWKYTTGQLARLTGYSEDLIELRLK